MPNHISEAIQEVQELGLDLTLGIKLMVISSIITHIGQTEGMGDKLTTLELGIIPREKPEF